MIYLLRAQKVMLDSDLAALYGVTTKALNQAVRRNLDRFPEDFMFQLVEEESDLLRSQNVTLKGSAAEKAAKKALKTAKSDSILRSQIVTSSSEHGGRRHLPFVFTEQGVAMLSSVLRSPRAVKVNIGIMRTFVRLRQLLASHADLERRLSELEQQYDRKFKAVFEAIRELMERPDSPEPKHGREIGFHTVQPLKEEPVPYRCFGLKTDQRN
ncbi:MAG: ORF6N domain-containing protein [Verrucomicrobia bacterium]|nr:ORF6N domain-containing protein [Verrucomicrobiota bacterium]